jgi:UDP-N-acetylglucosamine--N-acetylmuramyl-(pentapeptide) pyrophosphoryl-undecaprenol N-acetylglucosamine transferase
MIVITGGGTGGHLSIVKSLKLEFIKKGKKVIYIGSIRGQDKTWFDEDKDFLYTYFLPSSGYQGGVLNKFLSLWYLFISMIKVIFILKKHKVTKVVSVGGYSSAPSALIAILFKYNLYIHEQNSVIGRLNKYTKPFAKEFFCSFPCEGANKVGYPISQDFFNNKDKTELKTILFLGGSNGAVFINNFALRVAPYLKDKNINIIHQCGIKDIKRVKKEYERLNIKADVFDFTDNMYKKMQKADFAVSRSGASTLWELVASALPTLFIPYKFAIFNHQYFNAMYLVDKGLGFCMQENNFDDNFFYDKVDNLSNLNNLISNISVKLRQLSCKNGTTDIVNTIISE